MSLIRDIYNPPPAPVPWDHPEPERLSWTTADVVGLVVVCLLLVAASAVAWSAEPSVGLLTALSGTLVVLESWFTAIGYLHRHPQINPAHRMRVFLAALLPWVLGLGIAMGVMNGLFAFTDWIS